MSISARALALILFLTLPLHAEVPRYNPAEPVGSAILVLEDASNAPDLRNFHAAPTLRVSISGLPGENALRRLIRSKKKRITVVDLQQEPHLLINGRPFLWHSERDWAHALASNDDVTERERSLLRQLTTAGKTDFFSAFEIEKDRGAEPRTVEVESVRTEEAVAREEGARYARIAVTRHLRPSDEAVDLFLQVMRERRPGDWIHFHDRTGEGRARMFLVMTDILKNARRVPLEKILSRHPPLEMTGEDWQVPFHRDRDAFLRAFHEFASGGPPRKNWSAWLARKSGDASASKPKANRPKTQ